MTVSLASQAAPGRPVNEDVAFADSGLVGVLDGVSAPDGVDTGCRHGPAWYVARLAGHLRAGHGDDPKLPLPVLLADAVRAVSQEHAGQCDLDHPNTPASTVCLLKDRGDHV